MRSFGKLALAATLLTALSCGEGSDTPETRADTPDDDAASAADDTRECIEEIVFLNFEGYETTCGRLRAVGGLVAGGSLYDLGHYCPEGSSGDTPVSVEGFEGDRYRESEMAKIVDFVRCFFGHPLVGLTVTAERPAQGPYNEVRIGGQGLAVAAGNPPAGDCTMPRLGSRHFFFAAGFSPIDIGNHDHDDTVHVIEKARLPRDEKRESCHDSSAILPEDSDKDFRLGFRDLIWVVIHELGHAVGGLFHAPDDSLMSPSHDFGAESCDTAFNDRDATILHNVTTDICGLNEIARSEFALGEAEEAAGDEGAIDRRIQALIDDRIELLKSPERCARFCD